MLGILARVGVGCLELTTCSAAAPGPPREPTAGGKRLGDLLLELDVNRPSVAAYVPFRQFDSNAVPFLLYVVRQTNLTVRNSPLLLRVWRKTGKQPTSEALNQIRERAARAIGEVGSNLSFAASQIVPLLQDDDFVVSQNLAASLGRVTAKDTNALTALAALLSESLRAAPALAPPAFTAGQPAIAALVALAKMTNLPPSVRAECLVALTEIGAASPAAGRILATGLTNEPAQVRPYVASAVARLGPDALPVLFKALEDSDPKTRGSAASAITVRAVFLGSSVTNRELVAKLAALAKDPDARVRASAVNALQVARPLENPSIVALAEALSDSNQQVQWAAIQSLRNIGPLATHSIPALLELAGRDSRLREAALEAIRRIEGALPGTKK